MAETEEVSEEAEEEVVSEETEEVSEAEEGPASVMRTKPGRKEPFQDSKEPENNFDFSFLIRLYYYNSIGRLDYYNYIYYLDLYNFRKVNIHKNNKYNKNVNLLSRINNNFALK